LNNSRDGSCNVRHDLNKSRVEHDAPNGKAFTTRDLKAAIEKTEQAGRENAPWLGGVDVHHVFFEGIELEDDVWTICWGS
jgi:hypothetical protein